VVESEPMAEGMVSVDAETMAREIAETGSVSIYGIYFDTDRAEVKPESRPTLQEIATLLQAETDLQLYVVGHTDNTGQLDYNMDLSRRRADAVVEALVSEHGIEAKRLTARGVGPLAPVSSNESEPGKALNRRVELVRR
jgi:OOP family OmpA-OmpF porin